MLTTRYLTARLAFAAEYGPRSPLLCTGAQDEDLDCALSCLSPALRDDYGFVSLHATNDVCWAVRRVLAADAQRPSVEAAWAIMA